MRTLAAILLWGILLFNWVGYRLVNNFMQQEATRHLEARIDLHQYDESQLITIKVPVTHLSYFNHSVNFERVDGQIEINGVPYQYVMRRIYNDSVELRCIPNQMALKLQMSRDEYFRTVNDIQRGQRNQEPTHPGTVKIFVSDPFTVTGTFQLEVISAIIPTPHHYYSVQIPSVPRRTDERPPSLPA